MMRFQGLRAVVTGGASGIGAATVRRLAVEGAAVAVVDIDEAGSQKVAEVVGGVSTRLDLAGHITGQVLSVSGGLTMI